MTITTIQTEHGAKAVTAVFPTREDIASLKVGDEAPTTFGTGRVTTIYARRDDINGHLFVCYYATFGPSGSTVSHSLKESHLDRNLALTKLLTSAECDDLERVLLAQRANARRCA